MKLNGKEDPVNKVRKLYNEEKISKEDLVKKIMVIIEDEDNVFIRRKATDALHKIFFKSPKVCALLENLAISDEDYLVRFYAHYGLHYLFPKEYVNVIEHTLNNESYFKTIAFAVKKFQEYKMVVKVCPK